MIETYPMQRGSGNRLALVSLSILAFLVACIAITGETFWIDEGGSAYKAIQPTLAAWWDAMMWERNSNMQLPLYLLVLWLWEKVFGPGEWALRVLNLPFFLLTLTGFWLAFRDERDRFVMAVMLVISSAYVWFYLNQARPYVFLLSASTFLFAALYRLWRTREVWNARWIWWLTASALWVCATSMIAVPWAVCALAAAWYIMGWRFPLEFARKFPGAFATLLAGLAAIGAYYLWSLSVGADVPKLGRTGVVNLAMAAYELLGFAGLGPSRNVMRIELFKAFRGYQIPLSAYGVLWSLSLLWILTLKWKAFNIKAATFYLIVVLPIPILMVSGYLHEVRVLPRYLTPAVPALVCGGSYLAVVLWKHGLPGRVLILILFIFSCFSALQIRFAPRHSRDDYRSAAQIARQEVDRGGRVFWAADIQTAMYYGLIAEKYRDTGSEKVALDFLWTGEKPEPAPSTTVVVLSKPDIYDRQAKIRAYINTNKYSLLKRLEAFEVWGATK